MMSVKCTKVFFGDKIGIIIDKVSEYTVEKCMENNPIGMPEILI